MKIRAAQAGDAATIADLWNAVIAHSLATFTSELKTAAQMTTLIAQRPAAFWVADEGAVVGFATFGPFRTGPGYAATVEHTVILAPDAQGRGAGRALMDVAQKAACDAGVHVMVAGISSANPAAIAFHARLGFVQSAHMPQVGRKHGQWHDLILMQKTVSLR